MVQARNENFKAVLQMEMDTKMALMDDRPAPVTRTLNGHEVTIEAKEVDGQRTVEYRLDGAMTKFRDVVDAVAPMTP